MTSKLDDCERALKLDCVCKILEKRMDHVDASRHFIEADRMERLPRKVWILVELRYDLARGLTLERVLASKEVEDNVQPDYNSFKDKTREYKNDDSVKGLLKLINDDIQKACNNCASNKHP